MDAAFLFMLLAICALAGYSGGAVALARHSAAACAVHALPLLVIVCQLPWCAPHPNPCFGARVLVSTVATLLPVTSSSAWSPL